MGRSKQFQVTITRRKVLCITLRRFRTVPEKRSQRYKQAVLYWPGGATKEVAFRLRSYKRPRRKALVSLGLAPAALVVIGVAGSVLFGQQVMSGKHLEPPKTFSTKAVALKTAPAVKTLPASEPTNISIPAVGINVGIEPVGQDANGAIQLPPVLEWIAGWYKYSPTPGQLGPSVIVGHVDNYQGVSVFWRLREVQPGNDIFIARADGSTAHFTVTSLAEYSQADFPSQTVYGNIDYPGLRVITCGGTFNEATGSYDQNTVVYAKLVN